MNGFLGMHGVKVFTGAAASVLLMAFMGPTPALADTIEAALVRAYQNNPQLNAQRAQVRSTDENVPQALSGYRPKVAVTASAGYQYQDMLSHRRRHAERDRQDRYPWRHPPSSVGLTVNQTLYNGNQTANRTRAAESQVSGAREALRVLEQTVLLSGRHDLHGLSARFRDRRSSAQQRARARADAEANPRSLQCRRSDAHRRRAIRSAARRRQDPGPDCRIQPDDDAANFRRIIGNEPTNLAPGSPVDRFLPATLASAVDLSLMENPNVTASMFGIDVNFLQVKVNEGALLPTVTVQARCSRPTSRP